MTESKSEYWKSREKHCKECGKYFIATYPTLYAYKREGDFYCSWGCYRKGENRGDK